MICYRDMTFCTGDGCTKFATCPRALTVEVQKAAERKDFQIARYVNPRELSCWEGEAK